MNDTPVLKTALSISGASCQGCANKIRKALAPLTGNADLVEVDLEQQTVALPEGVDTAEAARIVADTGYPAEPCPGPEAVIDTVNHTSPAAAQTPAAAGSSSGDDAQVLAISGASCASCVNSRSEEHTSELQSRPHLVCRLLLEKKKHNINAHHQTHTEAAH